MTSVFLILLACICAQAQEALPQHVFTSYAIFEHVQAGWRCRSVGRNVPSLLGELRVGDVLTAVDGQSLATTTPIGMLQQLRLLEFGLSDAVEVERAGVGLRWKEPSPSPQVVASQSSLRVLRSTVQGVAAGDVLESLGETSFASLLARIENPLTAVANVSVRSGKVLHITHAGEAKPISIETAATVRLVQFDVNPTQEPPQSAKLHGLNTADEAIGAMRGRWTLLHFWATWCAPCVRHLPDLRDLAQQKNLTVAAIGFADSDERLAATGALEKFKVFSPDPVLQRELSVTGIPFDVLLDPQGRAALVLSGDMPGENLKTVVMRYADQ
jgi:thiol-disulfide isomerase/thioredoxin